MKITKAYYFHTFPNPTTGQWQKIGLEAELTEIDDYRQCLYELKRHVTGFYYESNKAAEKERDIEKAEVALHKSKSLSQSEQIIKDISTCKDLKVLQAYQLIAKNNPQLQEAYNKKLMELQ